MHAGVLGNSPVHECRVATSGGFGPRRDSARRANRASNRPHHRPPPSPIARTSSCRPPSPRSSPTSSPPGRSSTTPRRRRSSASSPRSSGGSPSAGWRASRRRSAGCSARASATTTNRSKGLYIWGAVGRGKTMLMDLFFDRVAGRRKRRVHFHDFMADVHDRSSPSGRAQKAARSTGDDPIRPIAEAIADEPGCCASTNSTSPTLPTP